MVKQILRRTTSANSRAFKSPGAGSPRGRRPWRFGATEDCHNPTGTDEADRPADKFPPESINFKEMIHRIHLGEENTREITFYGGGSPANQWRSLSAAEERLRRLS
jgi:hypothetical protein